jgi:2-C-methyl-D-erythritol 4-phosphate cytidylyltransferase
MNICVIIPAAGRGTRFGKDDKLARELGGRAVLLRTIECFTRRDDVASVIVAGPPDDFESFKERYGASLGFHGVTLVEGGRADRWETVRRALSHVPEDATHVAVHDAARPMIDDPLLDRLFEAASRLPAVIPAVDMTSTIKRIDPSAGFDVGESGDVVADSILGEAGRLAIEARPVLETADRSELVAAQTPQIFSRSLLVRAYEREGEGVTDDAQAVERIGETVHVVPGDAANIKITTEDDLNLCEALLKARQRASRAAADPFAG